LSTSSLFTHFIVINFEYRHFTVYAGGGMSPGRPKPGQ
jgi:hypothetical protein